MSGRAVKSVGLLRLSRSSCILTLTVLFLPTPLHTNTIEQKDYTPLGSFPGTLALMCITASGCQGHSLEPGPHADSVLGHPVPAILPSPRIFSILDLFDSV